MNDTSRSPFPELVAKNLLEDWLCKLANMSNLPRTRETNSKVLDHLQLLDGGAFEDTYVFDVDLMKDGAEIDIKTFDEDCLQPLQEFADWAREWLGGRFYLRFNVFLFHAATTFSNTNQETP